MTKDVAAPESEGRFDLAAFEKAAFELTVVRWQGRLECVYLNNFRVVGGKPWGGGMTAAEWKLHGRDVLDAFPELRAALACNSHDELVAALKAASGYLLNAKIDLETNAPKQTAIQTIEGGLRVVRAALSKAADKTGRE